MPPDDERSNYRLVRETLLDGLASRRRGAPHRRRARRRGGGRPVRRPRRGVELRFALNGIGADGHTASLFPDAPGLRERERRVVTAEPGLEPLVPRVTMTPLRLRGGRTARLSRHGRREGRGGGACLRRRARRGNPASIVRGRRTIAVLDWPPPRSCRDLSPPAPAAAAPSAFADASLGPCAPGPAACLPPVRPYSGHRTRVCRGVPSSCQDGGRAASQLRASQRLRSELLEHHHRVGDGYVLEVPSRCSNDSSTASIAYDVADTVPGRDHGERVADVGGKSSRLRTASACGRASASRPEHEERERSRVPADRRLGLGGSELERPARVRFRAPPVAGEQARLDGADRPPPAARRRVPPALPVALGRARKPLGCSSVAEHQRGEARGIGGVAHPRELPLPRIRTRREAAPRRPRTRSRARAPSSSKSATAASMPRPTPVRVGRCASSTRSTGSTACGPRSAAPARRASSGAHVPTTWPSRRRASCCAATRRFRPSGSATSSSRPPRRSATRD